MHYSIGKTFQPHFTSIAKLGFPIVIAQLGIIIQSIADTIMIGQYGTLELSAAAFTNNIFNLIFFFMLGYAYGTTPIIGFHYGKRDYFAAGKTIKESLYGNIILSLIIFTLLFLLYINLDILKQPEELLPYIKSYYLLLLLSIPLIGIFNSLKQFCDAVGDTKTPMWVMVLGNIVNIGGNFILIFGLCGFPEYGLVGAGIATLFSRVVMCLVIIAVLFLKKAYRIYYPGFKSDSTWQGLWHITKIGLPIGCQLSLEAASFNVSAIFMGWLGVGELAAHQIACTIGTVCFTIYYAIGAAVAIRISHFRAKSNWTEIRTTSIAGYIMTTGSAIILSVILLCSMQPLVHLFTPDNHVARIVYTLMPAFFVYQFGDCLQTIYANSLRAIEDVNKMLLYSIISYGAVSIPLSYTFAFILDLRAAGIWWAFPFGLTTAGLLFCRRFFRQTSAKQHHATN